MRLTARRLPLFGALLLSFPMALSACQTIQKPAQPQTAAPDNIISAISASPMGFAGRTLSINGIFSGWKGSCRGPVPATRSDWMLEDRGACLYVTGPFPKGFSAAPPAQGIGERITLTGTVEMTGDGRAFLRINK